MSWVAGVDVSTRNIDCVFVDDDEMLPPRWVRIVLHGQDAWERCRQVRVVTPDTPWDDTVAVGVEVAHGMSSGAVNRTVGAVLNRLPPGLLVQPWTAPQWKKAVGLKGNASKDDVFETVVETVAGESGEPTPFNISDWPQDACDAYCIALATRDAITIGEAA